MKILIATISFTLTVLLVNGQQEEQYTLFMYHKLGLNPAYAGTNDAASITALARNQWIGLEGAPQTHLITFNMPLFNKRVGVGGTIMHHTIGLTEKFTAEGSYAYKFRLGRGYLSMGIQSSVRLLRINFDEARSTQPIDLDEAIPPSVQSKYIPNFGGGIYYHSPRFYFGISAPRLMTNSIDFSDVDDLVSREERHAYIMGGISLNMGDKAQLQPQLLLKMVEGAPFDADLNLSVEFLEKYTTGISYRIGGSKNTGLGDALSALAGLEIAESFFLGLSYDFTISELRDYNSGSIEVAVKYWIGGKSEGEEFVNPRFF